MSSGTQSVSAKASPATTIRSAPATRHATTPDPVGVGGQPQRDHGVADQGEGQHQPDRQRVEPERDEVEDQDHREEPVPEHPQGPHPEEEPAIAIEAAEAGDETGVGTGGRRDHQRESTGLNVAATGLPECRR